MSERFGRPIAATLLAALQIFVWLPVDAPPQKLGLDESWWMALHEAKVQGATFGRDVVFTYGPWGFAVVPSTDPHTFDAALAFRR
jgi:hypothetical protein